MLKKTQVDLDAQHENCHKLEMNLEGKVKTLQDLSAQMNQKEETMSQLQLQFNALEKEKVTSPLAIVLLSINFPMFIYYTQGRQSRGCRGCTCTTTFSAPPQKFGAQFAPVWGQNRLPNVGSLFLNLPRKSQETKNILTENKV